MKRSPRLKLPHKTLRALDLATLTHVAGGGNLEPTRGGAPCVARAWPTTEPPKSYAC